MTDHIPIALFVGCLLATFGLVRLCEWLGPPATRAGTAGARAADTARGERRP